MAIKGTFIADFSQFHDAVTQASTKLEKFGYDAGKIGPRLDGMFDKFSGRKVIEEATLMAAAIDKLGGVSKLTDKEMQRVSATMGEAVAKMRATGEKVPDNMLKIADATKGANAQFSNMLGTIKNVAATFGVAFGAQQLMSFVSSVFDLAGAVNDMALEWGFSTEAVQKFSQAAKLGGSSAEDVGKAVGQMSRELGEGSLAYRAAVESVGLSFKDIRAMDPETAFRSIVSAIEGIEDPMLQADAAFNLFGKSGQKLLPAIRDGFLEAADAQAVMSDETIKRLEAAGDAWEAFGNSIKIITGELIGDLMKNWSVVFSSWGNFWTNLKIVTLEGKEAQTKWIDEQIKARDATAAASTTTAAATTTVAKHTTTVISAKQRLAELQAQEKATEKAQKDREDQLKKLTKAQQDYTDSLNKLAGQFYGAELIDKAHLWLQALGDTGRIASMSKEQQAALNATLADARAAYAALGEDAPADLEKVYRATLKPLQATASWPGMIRGLQAPSAEGWELYSENVTSAIGILVPNTQRVLDRTKGQFADFGKNLGAVVSGSILSAIQGGGDVLQSAGSAIGSFMLDPEQGGFGKSITKLTSKLPGMLGGAIGAALPIVGALAGPAFELIGKGIDKLFKKESRQVNDIRDAFQNQFGSLHAMNVAFDQVGLTLDRVLSAKKVTDFQGAIDEFNEHLKYQNDAMAELEETTKRYGFTIEELGPAMQRQELDKQAQQLFKDWEVLNAAGIDTIAITSRMGEEVSSYVQQAMAMGTEVPNAMRPMLESMIDMGTLTDANGNAITDLENSGITFAMTMSEGFNQLIAGVERLTDAISRGLGVAVDSTSNKIRNVPRTVAVDVVYNDPGFHAPAVNSAPAPDLESYQEGTEGFRNFGTGTPVMLHGMEAVIPRAAASTPGPALPPLIGGASPAAGPAVVNITINASNSFFDSPGSLQQLAARVEAALDARHGLSHRRRAA